MKIWSQSFRPYDHINPRFAFGKHDSESHIALSTNINPHLAWSTPPEGTQSLAVLCVDVDVPTVGDDVNQEGHSVPLDLLRTDFYHWVLFDLPATLTEISEGAHCQGITARGKSLGPSVDGGIQGKNDYTAWFAGDADMSGDYGGYDGPCPPWNDERLHGYHFRVFALDCASLGLSSSATGHDVVTAMNGHVLETAEIVGLYAINPTVRRNLAATIPQ